MSAVEEYIRSICIRREIPPTFRDWVRAQRIYLSLPSWFARGDGREDRAENWRWAIKESLRERREAARG